MKNNLRPTSSLVRDAVFNMLGNISDKLFLDLFCGTGQMGITAERKGAKVVYVDIKDRNIRNLKGKVRGRLVRKDALRFLKNWEGKFDIIYADPPYNYKHYEKLIDLSLSKLKEGGVFILEHDKRRRFNAYKERRYGDTVLSIWVKDEECSVSGNI